MALKKWNNWVGMRGCYAGGIDLTVHSNEWHFQGRMSSTLLSFTDSSCNMCANTVCHQNAWNYATIHVKFRALRILTAAEILGVFWDFSTMSGTFSPKGSVNLYERCFFHPFSGKFGAQPVRMTPYLGHSRQANALSKITLYPLGKRRIP